MTTNPSAAVDGDSDAPAGKRPQDDDVHRDDDDRRKHSNKISENEGRPSSGKVEVDRITAAAAPPPPSRPKSSGGGAPPNSRNNRHGKTKPPPPTSTSTAAAADAETDNKPSTPEDYGICTTESALKAARFAARAAQRMSSNSSILERKREESIPRFAQSEIRLGERLGRGGFSNVYEVLSIGLAEENDNSFLGAEMEAASTSARAQASMKDEKERKANARHQSEARDFIRMHCLRTREDADRRRSDGGDDGDDDSKKNASGHSSSSRTGDARYAVKFLRTEVMADHRRYKIGAADLVVEAKFLSCVEHPNIVKMRGVTSEGVRAFATGVEGAYFVLMDRLYDTLEERIDIWRKEAKRYRGLAGKLRDKGGTKRRELLIRRLCVAFDVAGALRYLHDRGVIYRDLKPENLGFDVRGDIRLFDFGLAKELRESEKVPNGRITGDVYKMSGNTGSLRYMAPEVALSQPYNLTVDVYSLGTMLWEMLTLSKPYDGFNRNMHAEMVVEQGIRPSVPNSWPAPLRSLIELSWSADINDRPSMESVYNILRKLIVDLRGGDDAGLNHNRRRSTFVMKNKKRPSMDTLKTLRRLDNSADAARALDSVNVGRPADSEVESNVLSKSTAHSLGLLGNKDKSEKDVKKEDG